MANAVPVSPLPPLQKVLEAAAVLPDGYAYALFPLSSLDAVSTSGVPFKVLHLVRHAQGTHNAAFAAASSSGAVSPGRDETAADPTYLSEEWADARLTDLGKAQSSSLRPSLEGVALDVVFTSTLSRTIETALLAVPPGPPFVAVDLIRERIGTHPCDRRRSKAALAADFPGLDLSLLETEDDNKWTPEREPWADVTARAEAFCGFVRSRKEERVLAVTHNDFLQGLLLQSRVQRSDDSLKVVFKNAQHLPLVLAWRRA